MTLEEIEAMTAATISPAQAASVLHVAPYSLNVKAAEGILEFPAFFSGNRLKIQREPFIRFVREGGEC